MEKVAYILGAGFSAPLGIPIVRNFLSTAKDLYFSDRAQYGHFEPILESIAKMHKCKSYYDIDLLDIEVILSILEMEDQVTGENRSNEFAEFVRSVINAKTPKMPSPALRTNDLLYLQPVDSFATLYFGDPQSVKTAYGLFVASLMHLRLEVTGVTDAFDQHCASFRALRIPNPEVEYGVITLNYDRVLEIWREHVINNLRTVGQASNQEPPSINLAKLHGSVDGEIVAPTWRKVLSGSLRPDWTLAHRTLSEANHIRILGYSLPETDSYLRYLLVSAVQFSENLKTIDVICLDDEQATVEERYRQLVSYKEFRFRNKNIADYLSDGVPDGRHPYGREQSRSASLGRR